MRWTMRWPIRKTKIPHEVRDIFDRYGETVVATVVAGGFIPDAPDLRAVFQNPANNAHARDWLTERGNISEWRTTRDFLLEIVIIFLIGVEIVLGARGLRDGKEQAKILADMNANIGTTAATLGTLQETQKNALEALHTSNEELTALADVRLSFIRTAPALRVQARNLSSLRKANRSTMVFLSPEEVLAVLKASRGHSVRAWAMILLAYRRGLRASEVYGLKLADIDLKAGSVSIRRLKGSLSQVQPLYQHRGQSLLDEMAGLRARLKTRTADRSDFLFTSQ